MISYRDLTDSDDSCDSNIEEILPGRKDIRRIKHFDELYFQTKTAKYEELHRKIRISEFEKELERHFPNGQAKNEMILDFDDGSKEVIVKVHPNLVAQLKDHQKEGIRFMWKLCFERVSRLSERGTGCILAHCMGLGKTLQVIALVHTILTNPKISLNKILILAPKNTILNWVNEFEKWIRPPMERVRIFNPARKERFHNDDLKSWLRFGGVCVLSYTKFLNLVEKSEKDSITLKLLDPGPDFIVCDEGHRIKNQSTKLSKSLSGLMTTRRVILSGTPLQNNLKEYYSMVNFVRPYLLGTKSEFMNMFVHPIQNGQYHDSSENDVSLMKARSHVLYRTLTSCVQRFDVTTLTNFLKEKREFVLSIRLTEKQILAYHYILKTIDDSRGEFFQTKLFADFQVLQRVWSHPYSLKLYDDFQSQKEQNDDDSGRLVWNPGWWGQFFNPEDVETKEISAKLVILFEIIEYCCEKQEKLLIFSQSLFSLKMIEHFLSEDGDNGLGWVNNTDYVVLTGESTAQDRDSMCQRFNSTGSNALKVFLISTRAGGLGITLNAANRAVIFDACWNPSHDIQSIFRIYRLGQQKHCFIYRFIAAGTMEEKIYERQVTKQSTSHRVIDEKQIARHYTANELQDLYDFQPEKFYVNNDILYKDELLAKIFKKYPELIGGYHEHDSLLQHKLDEELLEIEKNGAWTDFGEDTADVMDGAMAIAKMITIDSFHIENFKIVLRRTYPHLPEIAITTLVNELLPRVKEIFKLPNFQALMAQEALRACVLNKPNPQNSQKRYGKPVPVNQWGSIGGKSYGSNPLDEDSD